MPQGLVPQRSRDHTITLKGGTLQVSIHAKARDQKTCRRDACCRYNSPSPFSSPILLVKKKDGSWRFCVDYRALNKETASNKFPIPVIDELLDELHGAKVFSKLDLKSGYHRIHVCSEDVPKTAFRTHEDHNEFLVMPFELMKAPTTFQTLINEAFKPLLGKRVLVFFYDILVYSKSLEEHPQYLVEVLEILKSHQLYVNRAKCSIAQRKLEYLGHRCS